MVKLLVVVDYQEDFVTGALGFAKAETLAAGLIKLVESYRAAGDTVLFTYDTHGTDYLQTREGRSLPVPHCLQGSAGWQVAAPLRSLAAACLRVEKVGFAIAPAAMLALAAQLPAEISEITLVGVVTNMCVISNAIALQAQYPNAQIKVDAALCASFDEQLHEEALDVLSSLQVEVYNR